MWCVRFRRILCNEMQNFRVRSLVVIHYSFDEEVKQIILKKKNLNSSIKFR